MSKMNKNVSSTKDLKVQKGKNRQKSGYKDVNIATLKKNQDKVGVKKALKSTIEYLMKQQK